MSNARSPYCTSAVRVSFAGDRRNAAAKRTLGRLAVMRAALASRYDLYGGPLACGGSLCYGSMVVAHSPAASDTVLINSLRFHSSGMMVSSMSLAKITLSDSQLRQT